MIVTGSDFDSYANLSHEVAHYWWSKADFINEPWLNESFANYSMYLVLEAYDPERYQSILDRDTQTSKDLPPVMDATLFSKNAFPVYYTKGGILLKQLEQRIGKQKMMVLLRHRISKHIESTTAFLDEIETLYGKDDRHYFETLLNE